MKVLKSHAQFIHTEIEWNSNKWLWTVIYEDNYSTNRTGLWNGLCELASDINAPQLVQANFNAILHINDKMGGQDVTPNSFVDFQQCLSSCCLVEMRSTCCFIPGITIRKVIVEFEAKLINAS